MPLRAVIFDLGGTLIDWPDWDEDVNRRWALSYDYLASRLATNNLPGRDDYVQAMRGAEKYHWQQVAERQLSMTPVALVCEGFRRLGWQPGEKAIMAALDGYAQAVIGWATIFPDTVETLLALRKRGLRLGLLSNTWWAGEWHDADLATHGLTSLLDVVVYTSDLPYSKPHPSAFLTVTSRLQVDPQHCIMVGDRMVDDIAGALNVGMKAVWRETDYPWPKPEYIHPTAVITQLAELLPLVEQWSQEEQAG